MKQIAQGHTSERNRTGIQIWTDSHQSFAFPIIFGPLLKLVEPGSKTLVASFVSIKGEEARETRRATRPARQVEWTYGGHP